MAVFRPYAAYCLLFFAVSKLRAPTVLARCTCRRMYGVVRCFGPARVGGFAQMFVLCFIGPRSLALPSPWRRPLLPALPALALLVRLAAPPPLSPPV